MALRKNQRWLTAWEKKQFTDAVLALKAEKIGTAPPTNTYDKYVKWHDDNFEDLHKGPAFFAWHREFLRRFELDLQRIMEDATIGLPYWDWSIDQAPAPTWPFTKEFLGGNGTTDKTFPGKVVDGPFAYDDPNHWTLNILPHDYPDEKHPYLRRQFAKDPHANTLPTQANVQDTLKATPYDVAPWNENSWNKDFPSQSGFRNRAEGYIPPQYPQNTPQTYIPQMHNRVHAWVGGSMVPPTSPNDPVFFLHHCYVDKLWADWQALHKNDVGYQPYLPDGQARKGQNLKDPMPPWNEFRPEDVLNTRALGYHYDTDNYLMPFDVLYPGQGIRSASGKYNISYDPPANNLRLNTSGFSGIWSTSNNNLPDGWCVMQADGNLVIYDWSTPYEALWASNTNRALWGYLQVEDDGHLRMYDWVQMEPIDPPWKVPPPSQGNPPPYDRSRVVRDGQAVEGASG